MHKYILIYFLLLSIPELISGQHISHIEVSGNKIFSTNEYIDWIGIKENSKYFSTISDSAQKRIFLQLADRGYFHPSAEIKAEPEKTDSQKISISITIHEGAPVYLREINTSGLGHSDSILFKNVFEFKRAEIFQKPILEGGFIEILDYYENHGYPFAKIKINSISFSRDSLSGTEFADVFLSLDKARSSRIDKIEIRGNSKTNKNVIEREVGINIGQGYSQKTIDDVPGRLNKLRFFESVTSPEFYVNSKDEGVLIINVKERETNNFDGVLGYMPAAKSTEKGFLTGLVDISLRNLFGTGRAASIHWQQIDRYSQQLELKYLEPWVLGFPFNVNLALDQQKQDTTYVHFKLEGAVEYLASENFSAALSLSSESVIPAESNNAVFSVYNSSTLTSGLTLKFDSRDDFYSPRSGVLFSNSFLYSKKKINGPAQFINSTTQTRVNLTRLTMDFGIYKQFIERQIFALSLHGRELRGQSFDNSDLYRFGGTTTMRGYRENQFLANRILWSNAEYRLLLARRSYVFLFYDYGYYLRNVDPVKNLDRISAWLNGYGLGLNIETGLGILNVSYALGKGDAFSQGKIHFGIVNEF